MPRVPIPEFQPWIWIPIPVPASPQAPPPPARAHCRPAPLIGRFERAWRCVPDVPREPAAAGHAGSCSSRLPGQWWRSNGRSLVPVPPPVVTEGHGRCPRRNAWDGAARKERLLLGFSSVKA